MIAFSLIFLLLGISYLVYLINVVMRLFFGFYKTKKEFIKDFFIPFRSFILSIKNEFNKLQ